MSLCIFPIAGQKNPVIKKTPPDFQGALHICTKNYLKLKCKFTKERPSGVQWQTI